MDRRRFIATAAGLLATPLAARAQPAAKVPRLGYLGTSPSAADLEPFRQSLRALGRIEGENIAIEYRWSGGRPERLPALVADLIRLAVDIIYTPGSVAAAHAAKRATSTIPVVFWTPADPVRGGLVASLARPGGNVTGLGGGIDPVKRVALLKETVPTVVRVAVLWNPTNPGHQASLKDLDTAAASLGIQPHPVKVARIEDLEPGFATMRRERAEALSVFGDALFRAEHARIVTLARGARLPTIFIFREAVKAGGLMAYEQDQSEAPRRAAVYIDRILNGTNPADLPVELPTKFNLVINLKTAKALGLTIPPAMLARADEVIE